MANGVYSKYELYKISCREGNFVPGWCSPFSEVYKSYVQNEKRRVIWKGARSVPAVDQAPSGLANHPDNWLKLGDVCYSNPVFWLLLEQKQNAGSRGDSDKKGSTARTRECDLIAPSRRYHKLLVFFLKRKVRIRRLGELNLCTTGSLDRSRLLLRTGARRRYQRSCLRLTSLSLSSLRRQEVKSEWKFKKYQKKFERPKNWIRPFLAYFETISNYYGLSFRTHFLRHFLSNCSKFQV